MDLGLTCHVCGQLNHLRAQACTRCGAAIAPAGAVAPAPAPQAPAMPSMAAPQPAAPAAPPAAYGTAPPSPGGTAAPASGQPQRFDPATGRPLAGAEQPKQAKTMFFGALQKEEQVAPRLVVIKGEGGDGNTYHLQGTNTMLGRQNGDIQFNDDVFLSPTHAKFTSQDGRLFVQDAGSTNGVFLRIKQPRPLADGDRFLVGEQLLQLDIKPFGDGSPNAEGTYFYGSPRTETPFRVVQCLAGGMPGRIAVAENGVVSIGREGNTLNFPEGRFISGHHARVEGSPDGHGIVLNDMGSRNGTYVRLSAAQELFHGDYLFIGQQLLRVEIG